MRRAIIKEFDQLGDSLSKDSAVFAFRLKNLCVKAEEMSLLPIQVLIEGEFQKLEECTVIGKPDDYSFMIFPKYDEDMVTLGQSIMVEHPEFKQEIKSMTVDTVDENGNPKEADVRYSLLSYCREPSRFASFPQVSKTRKKTSGRTHHSTPHSS